MMLAEILEPITTKKGTLKPGQKIELSPLAMQRLKGRVRPAAQTPVAPLPQWQHDLCLLHGQFMATTGNCPRTIDDCFISRLLKCGGDLHQLADYEIGHGITCGDVLNLCQCDADFADLKEFPAVAILMADSVSNNPGLPR